MDATSQIPTLSNRCASPPQSAKQPPSYDVAEIMGIFQELKAALPGGAGNNDTAVFEHVVYAAEEERAGVLDQI